MAKAFSYKIDNIERIDRLPAATWFMRSVGLARKMENCALRHAGLDETKVIHG
jgi:hypothetical protein